MKAALEALDAVDTVLVTRTGPDAQLGYSWFITFTSDEHFNSGDVSSLVGDFSLVSAVNATGYICENGDVVAGTPCDSLASVRGNSWAASSTSLPTVSWRCSAWRFTARPASSVRALR